MTTDAPTNDNAAPDGLSSGFDDFYRREFPHAVRLAWLLTHSQTASEDAAQDAFLSIQRRFDTLEVPAAYLRTVIVNRCRTWHRREQRHQSALRTVSADPPFADPADKYLLDAVGALSYRQRVVIVARYWGDWSEAEIAEMLQCRPGTVKSLASRAIAKLRQEVPQ